MPNGIDFESRKIGMQVKATIDTRSKLEILESAKEAAAVLTSGRAKAFIVLVAEEGPDGKTLVGAMGNGNTKVQLEMLLVAIEKLTGPEFAVQAESSAAIDKASRG